MKETFLVCAYFEHYNMRVINYADFFNTRGVHNVSDLILFLISHIIYIYIYIYCVYIYIYIYIFHGLSEYWILIGWQVCSKTV